VVTSTVVNIGVRLKTVANQYYQIGDLNGYNVNGVEGATLSMTRGVTHTFVLNTPAHPFILVRTAMQ
jgi:hypothetical protein